MKIAILNGSMQGDSHLFHSYLQELDRLLRPNHQLEHFTLSEMNLKYCTGCWSCWWKTPGLCAIKDDADEVFRAVIQSDLLIFASPLKAGFTTSLLKKITDRLIILLHPYIQLINKECHHRKRYDKYPRIALLLQRENDTSERDLVIVDEIYDRLAINFHSQRLFTHLIENIQPEDLANEISHI